MSRLARAVTCGVLGGAVVGLAVKGCIMVYDAYVKVMDELNDKTESQIDDGEKFKPIETQEDLDVEKSDDVVLLNEYKGRTEAPFAYHKKYAGVSTTKMQTALEELSPEEEEKLEEAEEILENLDEAVRLDVRVDPNSTDALELWRQYVLREVDRDFIRIMYKLFNYAYEVNENNTEEGKLHDENLLKTLVEQRKEYLGDNSIWAVPEQISMAEVVMYYATLAAFDLDESIDGTLMTILYNCFAEYDPVVETEVFFSNDDERIGEIVSLLNHHDFDGQYGYGLFGLDDNEIDPTTDSYLKEYNIYIGCKLSEYE